MTDSTGVRIVSHSALHGSAVDRWAVALDPAFTIGSESGTDSALGVIASVGIGPGGDILVADRSSGTIRRYDRTGSSTYAVGGGRGQDRPETLWRASIADDGRIHVLDTGAARITVFEPDGSVAWSVPLPAALAEAPAGAARQPGNLELLGVLPGGETVVSGRPYADTTVRGWTWSDATVFGIGADGSARPIAAMPYMEIVNMPGAPGPIRPHFRAVGEATIAGGRIVFAPGKDYRLEYVDAAGRPVMSVRAETDPVPTTPAHLDAYRTWLFEQLGDAPEATLEAYREAFAVTPAAPALPKTRHIIADRQSCVWVESHPDPRTWVQGADTVPHRWDIFGVDGGRVGWALVPPGLRVRAADADQLVVTTESGAPRIQVHTLTRTVACAA